MNTDIETLKNHGYIDDERDLMSLKVYDNMTRKNALIWKIVDRLVDVFGYKNIHFLALNYDGKQKDEIIYNCHYESKIKDIQCVENAIIFETYKFDCFHILIINADLTIDAIEVTFLM